MTIKSQNSKYSIPLGLSWYVRHYEFNAYWTTSDSDTTAISRVLGYSADGAL